MKVEINDRLYKDIKGYCDLNNLNIVEFINKVLKSGYMLEKYGDRPGIQRNSSEEKIEEQKNENVKEHDVKTEEITTPMETIDKPKLQVKWDVDFEHDDAAIHATEIEKEIMGQHVENEISKDEPKRSRKRILS